MKMTVKQLRHLVNESLNEDLFNFTGKQSQKKIGGDSPGMAKVLKTTGILKTTVERLENAARDGDERQVAAYIDRIKQFVKAAEGALYSHN